MKNTLRKKYIDLRRSVEEKGEKSDLIARRLFEQEEYKKARCVAIYKSLPSEVSTDEMIKAAIGEGKTIALPKTMGNDMRFYKIEKDELLLKSPFGVCEPAGDEEKYISPEALDLIIVPGVAFDRKGNRLGFGKGCYDRYLANCNIKTVALAFSEQMADSIPADEFDVKMQMIITQNEVIRI